MPEETLLLVGLGNPGEKYKNNRHNVGFMVLDYVTNQLKFGRSRTKFLGRTSMGSYENIKLISFKPQTFMNESGRAVREASNFYKINPERISTKSLSDALTANFFIPSFILSNGSESVSIPYKRPSNNRVKV